MDTNENGPKTLFILVSSVMSNSFVRVILLHMLIFSCISCSIMGSSVYI